MHSNSDPFLLVSILWKIGLLLDCGWTSKAIAGTVDILPLRVSVGWLLLPESEKRWMPFCIQPIQDHNAGLPFQLLGGCGDSVPILSETENGRDGLRWWWDGHEQVGRETSSIYSILYTFEHLWSMHQAPRKHNEDDLAPACSCEEGLGPSLGDLRRVFQVMSYFSHWPLSLFYSKSLGICYVNVLPLRKRSGIFLCKKTPRKRSGNFYVKKKLYVRGLIVYVKKTLRKRSGFYWSK